MQKKGFTLIELLVVIAIIGILAAIGITAFGGAQAKARDSKRQADLGNLSTALVLYYDSKNVYPMNATVGTPQEVSAALTTAAADTAVGFAIPSLAAATDAGEVTSYWYIAGCKAGTCSATNSDIMGMFTRLEGTANTWFVTNSNGFSGKISDTCSGTCASPTGSNTACQLGAGTAAQVYQPCRTAGGTPTMDSA